MPKSNAKLTVFLNGKFLAAQEASLPVISEGFLYGQGLFETMRSFNGSIVYFDRHLERIKNSCKRLDIHFPYAVSALKRYVEQTVKANGFRDAYVRLTLWKKQGKVTDTLIVSRSYRAASAKEYKEGFSCLPSEIRINENSFISCLKTTNYLLYQLARQDAARKGYDEALLLNTQGHIAEASRSNIFFVKGKTFFTPALECGCLAGITRKAIFALAKRNGIKVCEGNFLPQEILSSEEAFLTNSLMGIMPIARIGKAVIGKRPFELTVLLMKHYGALLFNGAKRNKAAL